MRKTSLLNWRKTDAQEAATAGYSDSTRQKKPWSSLTTNEKLFTLLASQFHGRGRFLRQNSSSGKFSAFTFQESEQSRCFTHCASSLPFRQALEENEEDGYLRSEWADPKALKKYLINQGRTIQWRPWTNDTLPSKSRNIATEASGILPPRSIRRGSNQFERAEMGRERNRGNFLKGGSVTSAHSLKRKENRGKKKRKEGEWWKAGDRGDDCVGKKNNRWHVVVGWMV